MRSSRTVLSVDAAGIVLFILALVGGYFWGAGVGLYVFFSGIVTAIVDNATR